MGQFCQYSASTAMVCGVDDAEWSQACDPLSLQCGKEQYWYDKYDLRVGVDIKEGTT